MKTKDKNGFFLEDEIKNNEVLGIIAAILTIWIALLFFYEYFFEKFYWKNRFKLWKYLKTGKVEVVSKREISQFRITEYILKINDIEYCCWIYNDRNSMTLNRKDSMYNDYLGLFVYSPIMTRLNNKIIKRIKWLSQN